MNIAALAGMNTNVSFGKKPNVLLRRGLNFNIFRQNTQTNQGQQDTFRGGGGTGATGRGNGN